MVGSTTNFDACAGTPVAAATTDQLKARIEAVREL
jgi:hypothetical protein